MDFDRGVLTGGILTGGILTGGFWPGDFNIPPSQSEIVGVVAKDDGRRIGILVLHFVASKVATAQRRYGVDVAGKMEEHHKAKERS